MPLKNYGVLKGWAIDRRLAVARSAHYQIHLVDENRDYRIAINVKSKISPSELEYLIDEQFQHPIIEQLPKLEAGFHELKSNSGGLALDFIRSNLIANPNLMKPLPFDVPGPDNDLNEKIDRHILRAMSDEEATIYAFGESWGPESKKDKIFGFNPGNGIHDIHMNQGNADRFRQDDGVFQDGAMLIHFPSEDQWIGIFLKFQSQCWHTNDQTGHCLPSPPPQPQPIPKPVETEATIRIIAALVNPIGSSPEIETVTLINTTPESINLAGWSLADKQKHKFPLSGNLLAGATLQVSLTQNVQLSNQGGIITLLDADGLKVHGVTYTRQQARREGWTIVFY